jgi:putative Mg2+ transporter-C (MgtC) family protein
MFLNYFEILTRIGLTLLFVVVLGGERERRHKAAGITTHSLVGLSTCALGILQVELFESALLLAQNNPGLTINIEGQRLIAQVITGIGFLGGGAILKTQNRIQGLTTAATLWGAGVLGIIFGLGYVELGGIFGLTMLLVIYINKSVLYRRNLKNTTSETIEP